MYADKNTPAIGLFQKEVEIEIIVESRVLELDQGIHVALLAWFCARVRPEYAKTPNPEATDRITMVFDHFEDFFFGHPKPRHCPDSRVSGSSAHGKGFAEIQYRMSSRGTPFPDEDRPNVEIRLHGPEIPLEPVEALVRQYGPQDESQAGPSRA